MVLGIILFLASGALGSLTSNKPRQASQTALVLKFQHVSSCSAKIPFSQPYTIQECQNLRITLIINQNHLFLVNCGIGQCSIKGIFLNLVPEKLQRTFAMH